MVKKKLFLLTKHDIEFVQEIFGGKKEFPNQCLEILGKFRWSSDVNETFKTCSEMNGIHLVYFFPFFFLNLYKSVLICYPSLYSIFNVYICYKNSFSNNLNHQNILLKLDPQLQQKLP